MVLYHFSLRSSVSVLAFSPSGRYFAVALERNIEVWHTPSTPGSSDDGELEFAPFVRHRVYTGHFGGIQHIEWSGDSRFFISTSKDLTARMFSLDLEPGFVSTTLAGHKETVQGAWFTKDQETVCQLPIPWVSLAEFKQRSTQSVQTAPFFDGAMCLDQQPTALQRLETT